MADEQKVPINSGPIAAIPSSNVGLPMASVQKKEGEPIVVSEVLKPTEVAPEISPEVAPFVQPSQSPVPAHQIIKAAGENTPITFEPTGIVELPSIEEARETLRTDKKIINAKTWIAGETVREDDRTKVIRLSEELEDLKEAA